MVRRKAVPAERRYQTLTQVSESLGIATSSLRHQIGNGKLTATKVGPVWVVSDAEVERYRRESLGRHQAAYSSEDAADR
jgi:hypothetical protein